MVSLAIIHVVVLFIILLERVVFAASVVAIGSAAAVAMNIM